jgi:hypothetical protein
MSFLDSVQKMDVVQWLGDQNITFSEEAWQRLPPERRRRPMPHLESRTDPCLNVGGGGGQSTTCLPPSFSNVVSAPAPSFSTPTWTSAFSRVGPEEEEQAQQQQPTPQPMPVYAPALTGAPLANPLSAHMSWGSLLPDVRASVQGVVSDLQHWDTLKVPAPNYTVTPTATSRTSSSATVPLGPGGVRVGWWDKLKWIIGKDSRPFHLSLVGIIIALIILTGVLLV